MNPIASVGLLVLLLVTAAVGLGPQAPKSRPGGLPTYTPDKTGSLNGTAFTNWITQQAAKGVNTVALATGHYEVHSPNEQYEAYLVLAHVNDITIWMDGVNMTFPDNTISAFNIDTCSRVTTYGPTIWWQVPGFGQATITGVTSQGDNAYGIEFHLDDGYNCSTLVSDGQLNGEYTSPKTGRLQAGAGWSTISGDATPVAGKDNTFTTNFTGSYFTPLVGYKLLSRGEFLFCNFIQSSNYTTMNDFTMLNCGGFGIMNTFNRHTAINSFSLKRAPFPPSGGTELPARSSSADGFHSACDLVGPTIDSAFFDALDDDCIAIHGQLANATERSGNTFVATQSAFVGDVLRFYTFDTFEPLGTATVTASNSTYLYDSSVKITVDQIPAGFTGTITPYTNQNRLGSGFTIRNTQTTGNRGRGAIVKASNGVIENNVFAGVSYAALYLGPEFTDWGEADYVHNLTITNNTIRDCSYLDKATAAFDLHGDSDAEGLDTPGDNPITGNSNIRVSRLVISGTESQSNLYVGAANRVQMENVVIERAMLQNFTLWENTPGAIVNFQNAAFSGQVGICIRGGVNVTGVEAMKIYGNVTGAPSHIGAC